MRAEKCEACGGEVEFRREESVQGYYCKRCDWAVVTTYIPPIELDETKYQVRITGANYQDEKQVKVVSSASGLNFLQSRKLLQQENPVVFEGVASKVLKVRDALVGAGLHCNISPPFSY